MTKEKTPLKWKFETGDSHIYGSGIASSPTVSEGVGYFGSDDKHLYAVDIKTGEEKWKFETRAGVYSSPAVLDGVVYFGSADNHLYAVDIKTGKEKWKFTTGDRVSSTPAVSDDVVYFGSHDKHLYAVDIKTGEEKWKFKAGDGVSSPIVSEGVVYFGSYDNHLYAVDIKTGEEKWKFETRAGVYSSPAVSDGVVYCGSGDSHLYAVDIKTGEEKWKFKADDYVSSPAVSDGVVYFGSHDKHLYAVDIKTGKEKWKFKAGYSDFSPVVVDGVVYFGSSDLDVYDKNHLYAVDKKTGKEKWKFTPGNGVSSDPAVSDGVVYFGSVDKHLYAVDIDIAEKLAPLRKKEEQRQKELEKEKQKLESKKTEEKSDEISCEITLETSSPCTIVEKVVGSVEIYKIVDAILSGGSWEDSIEGKWYDYDSILHVYGTTDLASSVNFSDSEIQDKWDEDGYLDISDDVDANDFDIDNLEKGDYKYLLSSPTFILTAESYEDGKWNTYSIDIDGKFDPKLIKPWYEGGLIYGYEYDGMEMDSNNDMQSTTSHTDISIYLTTKDGSVCIDFDEIRSTMTEKGLDSENEDDIYKYFKDEYGVE